MIALTVLAGLVLVGLVIHAPGHVLLSALGSMGLIVNVPWAVGRFFPGGGPMRPAH